MTYKYKLIDNQNRAKLAEGRKKGVGFAFCSLEGKIFTTLDPLSPCKDFLAERIIAQNTGPNGSCSAWGLTSNHIPNLFDGKFAYMAFYVMKEGAKVNKIYEGYKEEVKALNANYKNVENVLHWAEENLKLSERSTIIKLSGSKFIVELPIFWTKSTYAISLYTLLLRACIFFDGKTDISEYLLKVENEDTLTLRQAVPRLKDMFDGYVPKQDLTQYRNWHNVGILFTGWYPKSPEKMV